VVHIDGQDIGVIVDAVTEVLRIQGDCIEPPSAIITGVESDYLLGIAKLANRLIILLALDKVLSNPERECLSGLVHEQHEEVEDGSLSDNDNCS
jgi:purine-binding chemotaxis protein CheW